MVDVLLMSNKEQPTKILYIFLERADNLWCMRHFGTNKCYMAFHKGHIMDVLYDELIRALDVAKDKYWQTPAY